jgi:hypothetical protein
MGLLQTGGDASPGGQAQAVDGWVAQGDYGHIAVGLVVRSHAVFLAAGMKCRSSILETVKLD